MLSEKLFFYYFKSQLTDLKFHLTKLFSSILTNTVFKKKEKELIYGLIFHTFITIIGTVYNNYMHAGVRCSMECANPKGTDRFLANSPDISTGIFFFNYYFSNLILIIHRHNRAPAGVGSDMPIVKHFALI